jgi:hypothetical protein
MNAIWFTVAGEDSYQEWTKYPSNAQLVSAWKWIYGKTFIQEVSQSTWDEVVYVCSANCQSLYDRLELRFGGLGVFHQTSVLTCLFSLCNMQEEVH